MHRETIKVIGFFSDVLQDTHVLANLVAPQLR